MIEILSSGSKPRISSDSIFRVLIFDSVEPVDFGDGGPERCQRGSHIAVQLVGGHTGIFLERLHKVFVVGHCMYSDLNT